MWAVDDYPGRNQNPNDPDLDGWPARQCTAFCVWRMRNDLGVALPAPVSGNAGNWANAAAQHGLLVDANPRAHDVAVMRPGVDGAQWTGHVAMVLAVSADGSRILCEQYDYDTGRGPFQYSQLWLGRAGVQFIHVAPTPPPPPVPVLPEELGDEVKNDTFVWTGRNPAQEHYFQLNAAGDLWHKWRNPNMLIEQCWNEQVGAGEGPFVDGSLTVRYWGGYCRVLVERKAADARLMVYTQGDAENGWETHHIP